MAFVNNPIYKNGTRLHDVVRSYQAEELKRRYGMTVLDLLEDRASKSFKNQALCTQNFHTAETLLFFIHDEPEVLYNPQATKDRLDLANSLMVHLMHKTPLPLD